MELSKLLPYIGTTLIVISILLPTDIQFQKIKKDGIYGSLFNKLSGREKTKLKLAIFLFIVGLLLLATSISES